MKYMIESNKIQVETDRAYLIKTDDSFGKNQAFWFPKKMTRFMGKNEYYLSIWAPDHFEFEVVKLGVGSKVSMGQFKLNEIFNERMEEM